MRAFNLSEGVEFNKKRPHAESLHSNEEGRALRFAFLPHQKIENFRIPSSPTHIVILHGRGVFKGADGEEKTCSTGMMVTFDAGEEHSVYAQDEKLVYVAIYDENPIAKNYHSEHREMIEKEGYPHEE